MIYREYLNNRVYPLVMFKAVTADGELLADHEDLAEDRLSDMPVIALIRQWINVKLEGKMEHVPSEIVVLGEPLKNTDSGVAEYFKDLK